MTAASAPDVPPPESVFRTEPGELTERLGLLRPALQDIESGEVLIQDLETAYEELQVADEELRTQQEQITNLLDGQRLLQRKHEQMLSLLPVAVIITDSSGLVRNANAAAAVLLELRVSRLAGKPIFALVSAEERRELRRRVAEQARSGGDFRTTVTLQTRSGRIVLVDAVVSTIPGASSEVSWMLLSPAASTTSSIVSGGQALPQALVQLARLASETYDTHSVLRRAVAICREVFGDDVALSFTAGHPLAPDAVASTSTWAQAIDGAQVEASSGPAVSAFEQRVAVVSDDIGRDARWRELGDRRHLELTGCASLPLTAGEELVGVLSVYGPPETVARSLDDCELVAATIAAVLVDLRVREELESMATDMERALSSRAAIDQAKGIIMADRRCGPDEAFEYLVRLSSTRHLKLRDLAERIVAQVASGATDQ